MKGSVYCWQDMLDCVQVLLSTLRSSEWVLLCYDRVTLQDTRGKPRGMCVLLMDSSRLACRSNSKQKTSFPYKRVRHTTTTPAGMTVVDQR